MKSCQEVPSRRMLSLALSEGLSEPGHGCTYEGLSSRTFSLSVVINVRWRAFAFSPSVATSVRWKSFWARSRASPWGPVVQSLLAECCHWRCEGLGPSHRVLPPTLIEGLLFDVWKNISALWEKYFHFCEKYFLLLWRIFPLLWRIFSLKEK